MRVTASGMWSCARRSVKMRRQGQRNGGLEKTTSLRNHTINAMVVIGCRLSAHLVVVVMLPLLAEFCADSTCTDTVLVQSMLLCASDMLCGGTLQKLRGQFTITVRFTIQCHQLSFVLFVLYTDMMLAVLGSFCFRNPHNIIVVQHHIRCWFWPRHISRTPITFLRMEIRHLVADTCVCFQFIEFH